MREIEVLQLISDGLVNREIGQRLFLSRGDGQVARPPPAREAPGALARACRRRRLSPRPHRLSSQGPARGLSIRFPRLWKSLNRGMSTRVWTTEATRALPGLELPAMAARDTRRITDLRTATPLRGTDGGGIVYPFWGRFKGFDAAFSIFRRHESEGSGLDRPPVDGCCGRQLISLRRGRGAPAVVDSRRARRHRGPRGAAECACHAQHRDLCLVLAHGVHGSRLRPARGRSASAPQRVRPTCGRPHGRWFVYTPAQGAHRRGCRLPLAVPFTQSDNPAFGRILLASLAAALTNLVA